MKRTKLKKLQNLKNEFSLLANIYAKDESENDTGSIKIRAAKWMIEDAEEKGLISNGAIIIEPTSGNTGIGIASICKDKGYKAIIVMPDSMSIERQQMIKSFGAEVVLTPGKLGMAGSIEKANKIQKETENSIIAGQFDNDANAKAHYESTGVEIYEDLDGKVDIFVSAVGTGGTITGCGKYLKEKNPNTYVVAVEPKSSAVLSGEEKGSHKIQGIGAGFVPKILNTSIYDEIIKVSDEDAYKYVKVLSDVEDLKNGISSGAAICAAIELAKREENKDKNIVVILPDGYDRYYSTNIL